MMPIGNQEAAFQYDGWLHRYSNTERKMGSTEEKNQQSQQVVR